jgi:hypothetical protein
MATPLKISIGLWYYCRAGDFGMHGADNFNAPAVQEALQDFVNGGLLGKSPPGCEAKYFGTDALRVWVEALCDVRWPVQTWVIPNGNQ